MNKNREYNKEIIITKAKEIKKSGGVGAKRIGLSHSRYDKLDKIYKKSEKILEVLG